MNKELDKLLCLLDGKITTYRMSNPYIEYKQHSDNIAYRRLLTMQQEIHDMWDINRKA